METHTAQHPSKLGFVFMSAILLIGSGSPPARAATFVVSNMFDGPSPGPIGSLRAAIHAANTLPDSDTIVFDANVFNVPRTIVLSSQLSIMDRLTILGPGADKLTISGNDLTRVFHVDANITAILNDLTIANGRADAQNGGGILSRGSLTMNRCAILNCRANQGAGLASLSGTLVMNNCEISQNHATLFGGGISILCSAGSSNVLLTNVTISGNSANSEITGGGLDAFPNEGLISVALVNCTVAFNTNGSSSGGIFIGGPAGSGQLSLKNTIVSDNSGPQLARWGVGEILSNGSNLISDDTLPTPLSTDMVSMPAMLRPLASNGGPTRTHGLGWNSPAIDTGSNTAPPETDQRGRSRMEAASCGTAPRVDRGAFEVQKFVVTTTADDGPDSLRSAVEENNVDGGGVICIEAEGTIHQNAGSLNLLKDVAILGPGADRFSLNGLQADRLFMVSGGVHALVYNLTLTHGRRMADWGGAIYIEGGTLDLRGCSILYSYAVQGGAILNSNGTLRMSGCEVSYNAARDFGGGLLTISQGLQARTDIDNSTITTNHCEADNDTSGGILAFSATHDHFLGIRNCTIADNTGGSAAAPGALTLWRIGDSCTAEIGNTIIAGQGPQIKVIDNATIVSLGHNLCTDSHPSLSGMGDLQSTDPLLGPLADNGGPTWSHAIGVGSPAVDAGHDDSLPPIDQNGGDRVRGCAIDIGAYELQSGDPGSGDFDGGGTDVSDTAAFVQTLLDPTGGPSCIADLNGDGFADGRDIQAFVYVVFGL